jgi:sortase (surface protein transpeptidase)
MIYAKMINGTYEYRLLSKSVVRYTDVGVLDPGTVGMTGTRTACWRSVTAWV